jgi:hypothetical protein
VFVTLTWYFPWHLSNISYSLTQVSHCIKACNLLARDEAASLPVSLHDVLMFGLSWFIFLGSDLLIFSFQLLKKEEFSLKERISYTKKGIQFLRNGVSVFQEGI